MCDALYRKSPLRLPLAVLQLRAGSVQTVSLEASKYSAAHFESQENVKCTRKKKKRAGKNANRPGKSFQVCNILQCITVSWILTLDFGMMIQKNMWVGGCVKQTNKQWWSVIEYCSVNDIVVDFIILLLYYLFPVWFYEISRPV